MEGTKRTMDEPTKKFKTQVINSIIVMLTIMAITSTLFCATAFGQEPEPQEEDILETKISQQQAEVTKYGLLAASIAFGLGAIGAGIAISYVGAAAMGAIGEKPEIAGQALIFVALAEGIVVFGFITSLMILGKV